MKQQGIEFVSEPMGFKLTVAGTAGWISSMFANLDFGQVAGIILAVVGVVMQVAAYRRNKAEDKRSRERHSLEMAVLRKKLGNEAVDFEESKN